MQDIKAEIQKLVKTIHDLMGRSKGAWVTWPQVARQQTGSAEAAFLLSGLATLPEWKHLFATTLHNVKLTDAGLEFVRGLGTTGQSITGTIADAVISYARSLRPIVLDIQQVSVVAPVGKKMVHAIFVELSDEVLPTETPVQVTCQNGRAIHGKLVGQEPDGDVLYIACDTDILPSQFPTKLIIDRAFLLTQLADQLQRLTELPERMSAIFQPSSAPVIADADSTVVAERLGRLSSPWTRYLWGPPGAGKTYGLAHFVARQLRSCPQESVLIVAPSNRAVDVAVGHLRDRLTFYSLEKLIQERQVLRFGYPRSSEVLEAPELLGPANLDELSRQVNQTSREIKRVEQEHGQSSELAVLRAKLLAAQEAVKDAVREHVARCSVVATTTTLAYMPNSPVALRMWDTVIVDEVTMVPPAVCAFLASRAKQRFLLAGDPCQLGPVYEDRGGAADGNSTLWLKSDVFTVGGVSTGQLTPNAVKTSDSRLARISAQRRCGTEIWDQVSRLYPQVGNASNLMRTRNIAALPPAPGSSVVLVNLSQREAKCEQTRRSWRNIKSAETAMQVAGAIASQAPPNFRIAIICPYRAQVKMLRQWIREEQKEVETIFKEAIVDAGTVHQFQGSEADAVVFDLVDGPGRKSLGLLLRGDMGTRLINVAISRARGKLVVIADREWCRNAEVTVHNRLLSQLVFNEVISTEKLKPFSGRQS